MHSDYEARGDPGAPYVPTKRDIRAQAQAETMRQAVARSHFHQYTVGESAGSYFSHTHDDYQLGHVHPPRQAVPARADGGYVEASGPSLGTNPPPPVTDNLVRVLKKFSERPATPDHQLMRWRLRLFFGHVVERTAHRDQRTVHAAFTTGGACPRCGLDPATIVAACALEPAGSAPASSAPREPTAAQRKGLEKRLTKARGEVARLEAELRGEEPSNEPGRDPKHR